VTGNSEEDVALQALDPQSSSLSAHRWLQFHLQHLLARARECAEDSHSYEVGLPARTVSILNTLLKVFR
jgi:hypothetical protein